MYENVFVDVEDDDSEETMLLQTNSDPTETLNWELHNIKLDLQRYQQDKIQLQYVPYPECAVTLLAGVETFFCKAFVPVKYLSLYKQNMAQTSKSDEELAPDNRQ